MHDDDHMNRAGFLKEMGRGFSDTVKGILAPFVEEQIDKIDDAANIITGRDYFPLPQVERGIWSLQDFFLAERSFYLIGQADGRLCAISKLCSICGGMLTVISFDRTCKCLICDKSVSLESFEGELPVHELEIVERDDKLFVLIE